MKTIRKSILFGAAAVLAINSGLALEAKPPQDKIRSDRIIKGELRPVVVPGGTINTNKSPEKVVYLRNLPDYAFQVDTVDRAKLSRAPIATNGGISAVDSSAYVRWNWQDDKINNDPPCPIIGYRYGTIDLSVPRSHGFRLHSFSQEELPPTLSNMVHNGQYARAGDRYFDQAGKPTTDLASVVKIKVGTVLHGAYYFKVPGLIPVCSSGYQLHISMIGPADIHPFTGQKIVHSPVN